MFWGFLNRKRKVEPVEVEPVEVEPVEVEPAVPKPLIRVPQPPDVVEYHFGFACSSGHVETTQFKQQDIEKQAKEHGRQICKQCGELLNPAVIKCTFSFVWWEDYYNLHSGWYMDATPTTSEVVRRLNLFE